MWKSMNIYANSTQRGFIDTKSTTWFWVSNCCNYRFQRFDMAHLNQLGFTIGELCNFKLRGWNFKPKRTLTEGEPSCRTHFWDAKRQGAPANSDVSMKMDFTTLQIACRFNSRLSLVRKIEKAKKLSIQTRGASAGESMGPMGDESCPLTFQLRCVEAIGNCHYCSYCSYLVGTYNIMIDMIDCTRLYEADWWLVHSDLGRLPLTNCRCQVANSASRWVSKSLKSNLDFDPPKKHRKVKDQIPSSKRTWIWNVVQVCSMFKCSLQMERSWPRRLPWSLKHRSKRSWKNTVPGKRLVFF